MKIGDIQITLQVNTRACDRSLDRVRLTLSRLRYPPKRPARGSVSRRREKLRKAGIR